MQGYTTIQLQDEDKPYIFISEVHLINITDLILTALFLL